MDEGSRRRCDRGCATLLLGVLLLMAGPGWSASVTDVAEDAVGPDQAAAEIDHEAPEAAADDRPAAARLQPTLPQLALETAVLKVQREPAGAEESSLRLVPAADLAAGDELRYSIRFRNEGPGDLEPGRVQVQTAIPPGTRFVGGSAGGPDAAVEYSEDGVEFDPEVPPAPVTQLRWIYAAPLEDGAGAEVYFHVQLD